MRGEHHQSLAPMHLDTRPVNSRARVCTARSRNVGQAGLPGCSQQNGCEAMARPPPSVCHVRDKHALPSDTNRHNQPQSGTQGPADEGQV